MNKKSYFIIAILIILIYIPSINALGVTPARKIVDFDNGLDYSGQFIVKNDEGTPKSVAVDIQGELADYASVDKVLIEFKNGETEKQVNYHVKIPSGVGKPGDNNIDFLLKEYPSGFDSGTYVGARLTLITSLRIRIPYPGKYVDATINVLEGDSGGNVIFVVPVHNLGTEDIKNVRATIEVKGPTNKLIETFETKNIPLQKGRREELRVVWNTEVNPGDYYGNVVVYYDDEITETGNEFSVGGTKIDLKSVNVNGFSLGEIAKFEIYVRNLWNEDIEKVHAEVSIYDIDDSLIGTFKTADEFLKSKEETKLLGYLDTNGIQEGEYRMKVMLYYGDKTIEREVQTTIKSDGIKANVRSTGKAIALTGMDYTFNSVFMIGLVVLIIINILWFVYFTKRKKNQQIEI